MKPHIHIHYTDKQVCESLSERSYSKSPLKPKLFVERVMEELGQFVQMNSDIKPFRRRDFFNAHTKMYVNDFFDGKGGFESNCIPWSKEFARSVRYTNSSLYTAICAALENPEVLHLSPTSGFHHATPTRGGGFCTFSGQVIASMKAYRKYGVRGAYLDLDGHFGNSIEDSRGFIEDKYGIKLSDVITANVNPNFAGRDYIDDLKLQLDLLEHQLTQGRLDYVVWCHGADSHEDDDLGHQLTTKQWVECSEIFYDWVKRIEFYHNVKLPVVSCLFGGYRSDDYDSVINLHMLDLYKALEIRNWEHFSTNHLKVLSKHSTFTPIEVN